jgi:DNA-binding winged helix-turn-helix (wHTH) protein/Tol biopolymer transport system component
VSNLDPSRVEPARRQYSFGEFTLDLDRGFLRRAGEDVLLRPKPFEVLAHLVERHGRLVTKTALIDAVWPDSAVTDNSLSQCLVEIRRALRDEAQQWIRTVPRRGYTFAAPVTTPALEFRRQTPGAEVQPAFPPEPARAEPPKFTPRMAWIVAGLATLTAVVWLLYSIRHPAKQDFTYTQITNFTDSVVSPSLSPDGRMIAFLRSPNWFFSPDDIYVKQLPDGEPVQITHDPRPKYGLAFSPDGSRLAYTVAGGQKGWTTVIVPVLGGQSSEMLSNAAGLTWLDERRILFSEIKTGQHMGVVTATESRSDYRQIYFPQDERGMAHLSYASPDRKWALVVEMNPIWQPCRVIPLDGSSSGRLVGPKGNCTSAAWSPDGKWMFFGVEVEGNHHLWRQRFPAGAPEQITSGLTEEDGVTVTPDGRSLITSIGLRESAVWIHDARGERAVTSEGYVPPSWRSGWFGVIPVFSKDNKSLFYLRSESPQAGADLWRTDIDSGKTEKVLAGLSILEYDISNDGKEVVFSAQPSGKPSQIWVAALDRSSPPQLIASAGEESPHFGPDGQIFFRVPAGKTHFLAQMNPDGSGRSRVMEYPIGNIEFISPDRRWITTIAANDIGGGLAVPVTGGSPRRVCGGCPINWSADGKVFYVGVQPDSLTSPGKTLAIPLPAGQMLPNLPVTGIQGPDTSAFPGSRLIDAFNVSPGPDPSIFAYVKTTMHRNLFRIPLRSE